MVKACKSDNAMKKIDTSSQLREKIYSAYFESCSRHPETFYQEILDPLFWIYYELQKGNKRFRAATLEPDMNYRKRVCAFIKAYIPENQKEGRLRLYMAAHNIMIAEKYQNIMCVMALTQTPGEERQEESRSRTFV